MKIKKETQKIKKAIKRKHKVAITMYLILRILVIVCMVGQSMLGNWHNVFLCFVALVLFTLPTLISNKLSIELPALLEVIVYLFIYASCILGEIQNFYGMFTHWDTMLHTLNGFLCAAVGFSLIDIINREERFHIKMSPLFLSIVAFCFSMTIGILWEFGEYGVDRYLLKDMQKDRVVQKISSVELNENNENIPIVIKDINKTEIYTTTNNKYTIDGGYLEIGLNDTMKDLFVNFLGAVCFSVLGYLYIKDRDEYKLIEKFIPIFRKN